MSIKVVLFDLDGTLLPMDQEVFVKTYFGLLAQKLTPHGYQAEQLIGAIWKGTAAMIKNDGTKTNEAAFWDKFAEIYGENARKDEPYFEEFYRQDFDKVQCAGHVLCCEYCEYCYHPTCSRGRSHHCDPHNDPRF